MINQVKIFVCDILELDELILSKMDYYQDANGHKIWQCKECHYNQSKSKVFKHIERKHVELQVNCLNCNLVYSSREELKAHMKAKHNNLTFLNNAEFKSH